MILTVDEIEEANAWIDSNRIDLEDLLTDLEDMAKREILYKSNKKEKENNKENKKELTCKI